MVNSLTNLLHFTLLGVAFGVIAACSTSPDARDAGTPEQLTLTAQTLVTLVPGASATLTVIVIGQGNLAVPALITVPALPAGLSTTPVTWNGESKITLTLTADSDAPTTEFIANVVASIDTQPVGTTITSIDVSSPDGALDPTFGTGGFVTLPFNGSATAGALASAGSGIFFLGGARDPANGFVVRLNEDGTFDSSYVLDAPIAPVNSLDVDPAGNVLATTDASTVMIDPSGHTTTFSTLSGNVAGAWDQSGAFVLGEALVHIDANQQVTSTDISTLDVSALLSYEGSAYVGALGSVNGVVEKWSPSSGMYVRDTTFTFGLPSSQPIAPVVVDSNGYFLVGQSGSDMLIARIRPDAHLDTTFGVKGTADVTLDNLNFTPTITPVAILPRQSGAILAVSSLTLPNSKGIMLARLLADGTLDGTFGTFGVTRTVATDSIAPVAAAIDESANRLCVASNVSLSVSTIFMSCYHFNP